MEIASFIINNWRLVGIGLGFAVVLGFLGFRSCNQYIGDKENEIIPIEDINVRPNDADLNCVRLTGKPCPRIGQ